MQKTHFFNGISLYIYKLLNGFFFPQCISISFTIKKKSPKSSTHNLSFEIYAQIFKFCDNIILSKIYSSSSMFIDFFKIANIIELKIKSNLIQYVIIEN